MADDPRFDETISRWLEQTAPTRLPDRALQATFERTRATRQHGIWRVLVERIRLTRFAPALAGAGVVALASALALGYLSGQPGVGGRGAPPPPFTGTWENDTDLDGSHQTMQITALPDGTYGVTVLDDFASVCDGVSSTMTGVAQATEPNTIVIAQPVYACDDGREPEALSGPPLHDQLKNLAFEYAFQRDQLKDSLGAVWSRVAMGP